MQSFDIFFERKIRNPLRKEELKNLGIPNNKEWVDQESKKLNPDEKKELRNMARRKNVSPEDIEIFKQRIENEKRKKLESKYLTGKRYADLKLLGHHRNVKLYADQYVEDLKTSHRSMMRSIKILLNYYKDILPRRGFSVILTNNKNNPNFARMKNIGSKNLAIGYYQSGRIYIDEKSAGDSSTLLHEYAHLLADRVSKQVEPILRNEYEKMINSYFEEISGKRSRKKNLEGAKNEINRIEIANKLGLPSPYSSTNFDEWFATIIENWKYLPNNKHNYKFKTIFKKIITRL
jgi:hypothetical protein